MVNDMNKQEIFDILKATPGVVATSDVQLITRCFLCGDSAKNKNKKRLGIKIDVHNPSEPILYHCFNCNAYGVLTPEMLNQMGVGNGIFQGEISNRVIHVIQSSINSTTTIATATIIKEKLHSSL